MRIDTLRRKEGGLPSDLEDAVLGRDSNPAFKKDAAAGGFMTMVNRLRTSKVEDLDDVAMDEIEGVLSKNKKVKAAMRANRTLKDQLSKESVDIDGAIEQATGAPVDPGEQQQRIEDLEETAEQVAQREERLKALKKPLGSADPLQAKEAMDKEAKSKWKKMYEAGKIDIADVVEAARRVGDPRMELAALRHAATNAIPHPRDVKGLSRRAFSPDDREAVELLADPGVFGHVPTNDDVGALIQKVEGIRKRRRMAGKGRDTIVPITEEGADHLNRRYRHSSKNVDEFGAREIASGLNRQSESGMRPLLQAHAKNQKIRESLNSSMDSYKDFDDQLAKADAEHWFRRNEPAHASRVYGDVPGPTSSELIQKSMAPNPTADLAGRQQQVLRDVESGGLDLKSVMNRPDVRNVVDTARKKAKDSNPIDAFRESPRFQELKDEGARINVAEKSSKKTYDDNVANINQQHADEMARIDTMPGQPDAPKSNVVRNALIGTGIALPVIGGTAYGIHKYRQAKRENQGA